MKFAIVNRIKRIKKTQRGKNALTYGICLIAAMIFWLMMSLNDEVQRDFQIPINISDLPEEVTLLDDMHTSVNVTVKDQGRNILRYDLGNGPSLTLGFKDFEIIDGTKLILSQQRLKGMIRDLFSNNAQIIYSSPDSISIPFTAKPGLMLPIVARIDALASPQHVVFGEITTTPDSAMLFSADGAHSKLSFLPTALSTLRDLRDTTEIDIKLDVPTGMKAYPEVVKLKIPVQPVISRQKTVNVKITSNSSGRLIIPFPQSVTVSYLTPMSMHNTDESSNISVFADFSKADMENGNIPVEVGKHPSYIQIVEIVPSEVEFVEELQK